MGKIFITGGSGGGTSSDELTVTSENVLEGESYVGSDTDDEIGTGTMKDYSGVEQTATASLDSTNSQLEMTIPNTGKYSALSKLSATFATIANLIGIDTSKMLNTLTLLGKTGTIGSQAAKTWYATTGDQTVIAAGTYASGTQKLSKLSHTNLSAGNVATGVTVKVNNGHADVYSVTGTYKGKGTATAAQVLTGYTFSSASLSGASGTMANKTGWTHTFTPTTSQQSQTVPAGYHNGGYKVYCNAIPSNYVNVTSGVTVFHNGTLNTTILPKGFLYAGTAASAPYYSYGLEVYMWSGYTSSQMKTAYITTGNTIDLTPFSTLTVVFNRGSTSSAEIMRFSVNVSSSSYNSSVYSQAGSATYRLASAGYYNDADTATHTLTIDVSSINQHAYIVFTGGVEDEDGAADYMDSGFVTSIKLS